ncbi:hypothetical protein [Streptomyces sp. CMB-StM0423]|uniref:hypothetical protein n=1 Tax=Streptomyces sp. CMB-StM0423 TaxID=2059884 RepID=UPI001F320682|nr:hypothetical protein [Streptomyces sp. CMB-StM0423]
MDPVSVGLLVALAGGAGGEIGRDAWAGLVRLVRMPFRRDGGGDAGGGSAEAELTRLAEEPTDEARAQALSTALAVRAALDGEFRAALRTWHEELPPLPGDGADSVSNSVSGQVWNGPVVQGRDFHAAQGIHIESGPPPPDRPQR